MKLKEIIIEKLKERGMKELPSNSRKYKKFTHPLSDRFYWVGKSGALRVGRTIGESYSISSAFWNIVKKG